MDLPVVPAVLFPVPADIKVLPSNPTSLPAYSLPLLSNPTRSPSDLPAGLAIMTVLLSNSPVQLSHPPPQPAYPIPRPADSPVQLSHPTVQLSDAKLQHLPAKSLFSGKTRKNPHSLCQKTGSQPGLALDNPLPGCFHRTEAWFPEVPIRNNSSTKHQT